MPDPKNTNEYLTVSTLRRRSLPLFSLIYYRVYGGMVGSQYGFEILTVKSMLQLMIFYYYLFT